LENLGDECRVSVSPGALPALACETFASLEVPSCEDMEVLSRQIARTPAGRVFIARRCPQGMPAVILTVPTDWSDGPFPPLLWLSCPHAAREAGRLESEGLVRRFDRILESDNPARERFTEEESEYARLTGRVMQHAWGRELAGKVGEKGVAGGSKGAVKCLHAHLAFRLASGRGQMGGWCLDALEKGRGLWCEKKPRACLD
jgi:hypothetical protein